MKPIKPPSNKTLNRYGLSDKEMEEMVKNKTLGKRVKDITGKTYYYLTAERYIRTDLLHKKKKAAIWSFVCECKKVIEAFGVEVKVGNIRSCGCKALKPEFEINNGNKKCNKCLEVKTIDQFLKIKNKKDGTVALLPRCRKCSYTYRDPFRLKQYNREKLCQSYGITTAEYNILLQKQNGKCICGKLPTNRSLAIDHKHLKNDKKLKPEQKRKQLRGLLCDKCNRALGMLKDNPEVLRLLANYLDEFNKYGSAVDRDQ